MNIEVTSVSKKEQKLSQTPAAIYVITQADIERSGATHIPDLLRMVPGVDVAQVDANRWAISIRGFNDIYSNKVLVMIDGRTVYNPVFSGVYWDETDVPLNDIQRIEVIRGPGGTIWGANAVNGVINVITKDAKFTRGELLTIHGGVVDRAGGSARFGGGDGRTLDYRGNVTAFNRGPEFHPDRMNYDQWRLTQGGFRLDGVPNNNDTRMLKGDIYKGTTGEGAVIGSFNPPGQLLLTGNDAVSGANAVGQWRRKLSGGAGVQINSYYDLTNRRAPHFEEHRTTGEIDFLHNLQPWHLQNLTWGLQARLSPSRFTQTIPTLDFEPRTKTASVYGAFLQDEIRTTDGKLSVTVGSKFERNNYTGLEIAPSVRLLVKPNSRNNFWAAVTRSVRTPARTDEDVSLTLFVQPGLYGMVIGNHNLKAEQLIGYEAGYRSVLHPKLGMDIALFHNEYNNLVDVGAGTVSSQASPIPHILVTLPWVNGINARTDGFEVAPDYRPIPSWRLKGSYSFVHVDAKNKPGNNDINSVLVLEGSTPKHLAFVQSSMDLSRRFEFDQSVRYASSLPAQQVREYITADARFSWHFTEQAELAVVGQNLLQPHHAEFGRDLPPIVQIRRNAYVELRWQR